MGADKKEQEVREDVATKMLKAGRPQSEVVEFSDLPQSRVSKLAKIVAAAAI